MKVILLEDVKKLGKKDDIIEVAEGYAKNYIFPKKLGVEANKLNMNNLKLKKIGEEKREIEKLNEAQELAKKLESLELNLSINVGKDGKVHGSISSKDIALCISQKLGFEFDKRKIVLDEAIKTTGKQILKVKLHPKVIANITILVLPTQV